MDIEQLKKSPCLNAYTEPQRQGVVRHHSLTEVPGDHDESDAEISTDEETGDTDAHVQSPGGI